MIKKKLIGNLIDMGKKGKMLKNVSLALVFVVSFFFNSLKVIDLYKFKIGAVALALVIASIYSGSFMNVYNSIDAAEFDDEGMYEGEIVTVDVVTDDVVTDIGYDEPQAFMTDEAAILSQFNPDDWKYILVNKTHSIEDSFDIETVSYGGYKVDKRIIDSLKAMFADAKKEGYNLTMASGFRTKNDQVYLYNRKVNQYRSMGYSKEEAAEKGSMFVTPPNTSEHQTGLAVDILSTTHPKMNWDFGDTNEAKWLAEHCHEYGFILRYPKGKEDVTMINYEPWHFRYVGEEAAAYIVENDLCYEEFYELISKVNE